MELNYKNKVPIKLGNMPIPYRLDRETRWKLCKMMKKVDNSRGYIIIISSENDAGKKLNGLGGIGAVLRYRVSYG